MYAVALSLLSTNRWTPHIKCCMKYSHAHIARISMCICQRCEPTSWQTLFTGTSWHYIHSICHKHWLTYRRMKRNATFLHHTNTICLFICLRFSPIFVRKVWEKNCQLPDTKSNRHRAHSGEWFSFYCASLHWHLTNFVFLIVVSFFTYTRAFIWSDWT